MQCKRGVLFLAVLVLLAGSISAALAQTAIAPLEGLWLTEGYGMALEVSEGIFTVSEVTSVSCLPLFQGVYEGDAVPALGLMASRDGDRLILRDSMTLYITAQSVDALPAACAAGGTQPGADPELNFEIFWHTFNEQYAFFDLYDVDWQAQYEVYRPQVTARMTDQELFALLSNMLMPLKDGHISLAAGDRVFSPGDSPAWVETGYERVMGRVSDAYLDGEGVTTLAGGLIAYRSLDETTGYILITQMAGFGTADVGEVEAAGLAIDEAIAALADKAVIVVDVRFNTGGFDAVALALAGRFADQERLAFSKQARDGDSFTPMREYVVRPEGAQQLAGRVVVLTGGMTASAAEIFVMAMQALPNILVIGEPTSGGFSDVLTRHLPNGWTFGLSNEVYRASDNAVYEWVGIPPAVHVPFDAAAFAAGTDTTLEAALITVAD